MFSITAIIDNQTLHLNNKHEMNLNNLACLNILDYIVVPYVVWKILWCFRASHFSRLPSACFFFPNIAELINKSTKWFIKDLEQVFISLSTVKMSFLEILDEKILRKLILLLLATSSRWENFGKSPDKSQTLFICSKRPENGRSNLMAYEKLYSEVTRYKNVVEVMWRAKK